MVEIYADGADVQTIRRLAAAPRVAGFTTNPSLMRKAGVLDYRAFARQVLDAARGKPVSFEVFADNLGDMERQAKVIAAWGPNVYVKIPVTTSLGEFTGPVLDLLSEAGVKLNVTAIMTEEQMRDVRGALGNAPAIISVFAGRIADTGRDPVALIRSGMGQTQSLHQRTHKLLWASAREIYNLVQAEEAHCDIITLSPELIAKLPFIGRDLASYSLETVRQFKRDAEGFTL